MDGAVSRKTYPPLPLRHHHQNPYHIFTYHSQMKHSQILPKPEIGQILLQFKQNILSG